MFTGLVEACVPVRRVESRGAGLRLWLPAPESDWRVAEGDSIAISGACLSVVGCADPDSGELHGRAVAGADLVFDLSAETLARTWFAELSPGVAVNIERPLALGERLDGHLVAGHVDGVGRIAAVEDSRDGGRVLAIEIEPPLARYVVDKGSVTLDGVSLTVVSPRESRFDVALIPITLEKTSLGTAGVGRAVNVEVDMIGKWIERLMPR
jgi:riboflavin synthase